jgi:GTP-binding protein
MSATALEAEKTVAREDLRNVAVIAHVDHGKTTLVEQLMRQTGAEDKPMDSMDLEQERGITILAKNASVLDGDVRINLVDTPGHADFGGEVERGLTMVDGVLLLVDASEGPLPQTRFVLRKALERRLPVILCINKVDRDDARVDEVVDEVYELFFDLDAAEDQIEFPIVSCSAKLGRAALGATTELGEDLRPLLDVLREHVPAPRYDPEAPLQAWVTNLAASPYVGRLALTRVMAGTLKKGAGVALCRVDGTVTRGKLTEVFAARGLERVPVDEVSAGDICTVAGIEDIMIGETIADPEDPRALPVIKVDEPSLSVTIGINTSPLAGRDGDKLTARQVRDRLDRELVGNVSIRVMDTERPDAWEVQGRGEMALGVLVETMRREGYELTVGKPQVVTREIDGKVHEPFERMTIDAPDEHVGGLTQLLAARKGRLVEMHGGTSGWTRMTYVVPARGLIGFRTEFLTETRGAGVMHAVFEAYEPWAGEIRTRRTGSLVADRSGVVTAESCFNLQDRGSLFVEPTDEVYEGMVVGENLRSEDLDVNIVREKHLTNVRSSTADELERLVPARKVTLDAGLEFLREDECLEVTPEAVRLRKVLLQSVDRVKAARKAKNAEAGR